MKQEKLTIKKSPTQQIINSSINNQKRPSQVTYVENGQKYYQKGITFEGIGNVEITNKVSKKRKYDEITPFSENNGPILNQNFQ